MQSLSQPLPLHPLSSPASPPSRQATNQPLLPTDPQARLRVYVARRRPRRPTYSRNPAATHTHLLRSSREGGISSILSIEEASCSLFHGTSHCTRSPLPTPYRLPPWRRLSRSSTLSPSGRTRHVRRLLAEIEHVVALIESDELSMSPVIFGRPTLYLVPCGEQWMPSATPELPHSL